MTDFLTDLAALSVGAEDFLAAVLESAAQPIWVVDVEGRIRFANPAAVAALGYDSAGELLGRRSHETIHYRHPDGTPFPAAECPLLLPRTTGETVARDLDWFIRRDGAMFPVSYVSVPIEMPEGRGAVVAFADIEDRLRAEQVLREHDAVLGAREDSLRRIAALVAGGAASADVFAAIAREVGHVVGPPLVVVWRYDPEQTTATVVGAWSEDPHPFHAGTRWPLDGPTILAQVLETGCPKRIDDLTEIPGSIAAAGCNSGFRAAAGAPIIVDGDVWGAMTATARGAPLPDHLADRLAEFTELVATAIANTEARAQVGRLADEQAALRRVATLVAHGTSPDELFAAVVEEVGRVFPVEFVAMGRYESDATMTTVATSGQVSDRFLVGGRWTLGGKNVSTVVFETGRSARIDSYADASGAVGVAARERGLRSSIGTPIVVEGRLWGVMTASSSPQQPLPADAEARLASFTELVATAIANTESRAGLARLASEQAALRRVATLVARGTRPEEVFAAVANEVAQLLSVDLANVYRYESDGTFTIVASAGERFPVGSRWPLGGQKNVATLVSETGRSARIDDYADATGALADEIREQGVRSGVGTPIVVEGRLWGVIAAGSSQEPLPLDTDARLASFTELVATAISNTESRAGLARLAEEQAALRRVATLVARGTPEEVFAAVTNEVARLLSVDLANMGRYESDGTFTFVASAGERFPVGSRWPLEGQKNLATLVFETGRPARLDNYRDATGPLAEGIRGDGIRSAVGTPITVEGRLWGLMTAGSSQEPPLPPDTEARLASFTELVATAIGNTEARAEVAASRARIVAATDDERRRVVRDLHDGAQQRLVHTMMTLQLADRALQNEEDVRPLLTAAFDHAKQATAELRELSHGILPAALTQGGLRAGVDALASRTPVPVEIDVTVGRLPAAVEATAYFVVAEALTNVAKHARARRAEVMVRIKDGTLAVQVGDDGVGGARRDGSGLTGLVDRLAVLDGQLRVESPADGGTLVAADIPLPDWGCRVSRSCRRQDRSMGHGSRP